MKKLILLSLLLFSSTVFAQTSRQLMDEAFKYELDGQYDKAVELYRKAATAGSDTMLLAAQAYSSIASIYAYYIEDPKKGNEAQKAQQYYIKESIKKYPENMDAYIYRLLMYKWSENKEGRDAFIQLCESKFGNRWEMTFALAHQYILFDFMSTGQPDYEICVNYLKRTLELNPNEFNALLHLSIAYQGQPAEIEYLKRMYALHPEEFKKDDSSESDKKYPYRVTTIRSNYSDVTMRLTVSECKAIGLIK